jgi:hypothetical protein
MPDNGIRHPRDPHIFGHIMDANNICATDDGKRRRRQRSLQPIAGREPENTANRAFPGQSGENRTP